jgi:hypothetical protein
VVLGFAPRSAEISALNLDKFVDDTVEAAAEQSVPVALPELEVVIVASSAMQGRFDPHPQIAGAHYLDWHGTFDAVTFGPELFDQYPDRLQLLPYGRGLLEEILPAVDASADQGAVGDWAGSES